MAPPILEFLCRRFRRGHRFCVLIVAIEDRAEAALTKDAEEDEPPAEDTATEVKAHEGDDGEIVSVRSDEKGPQLLSVTYLVKKQ